MNDPIKYVCDILKKQLDLTNDQIWIYNQKRDIPNDFNMYIVADYNGQRIIGSVRKEKPVETGLIEYQSLHSLAVIRLDLFSRGNAARLNKDLVIMALNSTYSQQVQEAHGFSIARNSFQVTNATSAEGTAELNRYSISFNVTYMSETTKSIDFYDTFSKEVITEE